MSASQIPDSAKLARWVERLRERDPEAHAILAARLAAQTVPSFRPESSAGVVAEAVAELAPAVPQFVLETIVREGRPALFVEQGRFTRDDSAIDDLSEIVVERLEAARPKVEPAFPLVGRIDVANHPNGADFLGTGWLIDEDVVVTNRHVAELLAQRGIDRYEFVPGQFGEPLRASLAFGHERFGGPGLSVALDQVLYIEPAADGPDLALIKVVRQVDGTAPKFIALADSDPVPGQDVVVVGYPARASSRTIPDQERMERLYGRTYNVKRAAPGKIDDPSRGWTTHDCTTLGGNSGSVVLDMHTGAACALHFAGLYLVENYAVPASILRRCHAMRPWPYRVETTPAAAPAAQTTASGDEASDLSASEAPLLTQTRLEREPEHALADDLVTALRRRDYSVSDLLKEAGTIRHELIATADGHGLAREIGQLDELVLNCVERTSLIHEAAIETSLHGFCELDDGGRIGFANHRMLELAPGCAGKRLAGLFTEPDRIAAVMASGQPQMLRTQIAARDGSRPVLLELGTTAELGIQTRFALVTDMSCFVDAEQSVYERAPYGVVRLDSEFRVLYYNPRVPEMFERATDEIIGHDVRKLIQDDESRQLVLAESRKRPAGVATEYDVRVPDSRIGVRRTIRVSSVPEIDAEDGSLVGVVTTFHDLTATQLGEALTEAAALERDPEAMFGKLTEAIRGVIDFERASLSVYTDDRRYARTLYTDPGERRLSLWIEVPQAFQILMRERRTCVDDIDAFLSSQPHGRALREEPSVAAILQAGFRSSLSVPLGAGPRGTFSMISKKAAAFNDEQYALLAAAGIDRVMHAVLEAHQAHESARIFELLKQMAGAKDSAALAETIVESLSDLYRWQNVSIFKVNRIAGRFELLAQRASQDDGILLPEKYTQALDLGLLGRAYATGAQVELGDPSQDTELAHLYVPGSPDTKSELCIPIRFNNRVVWILNCEDRRRNAFKEAGMLHRVIDEVSSTLAKLFERLLLAQLIEKYPDGVVVASAEGTIRHANKFAYSLFGEPYGDNKLTGQDIDRFFPGDLSFADERSPFKSANNLAARVVGTTGRRTPVLLSTFTLPDEYDQYILILQDAKELRWQAKHQKFNAALAEVTAQVRVPLAIATSNIRYLERRAGDPETRQIMDRACAALSRVELTYDRLQLAFDPSILPREVPVEVDVVQLIDEVIGWFSPDDAEVIKFERGAADIRVVADRFRLTLVVEAILSYLVRTRAEADEIGIRLRLTDSTLVMHFAGSALDDAHERLPNELLEDTRAEIAFGEKVIRRAIGAMGQYRRTSQVAGRQVHTLTLRQPGNGQGIH